MQIPSQKDKRWTQTNSGDVFGNVQRSRNLNFNENGYLSLNSRSVALFKQNSSGASFDDVVAIPYFNGIYHVLTSDQIFLLTPASGLSLLSGGPSTVSLLGDGCVFNNLLYVTNNSGLYTWSGAFWTTIFSSGLDTTKYHSLCVFESLNYLALANGNTVRLYDTSNTLQVTLTIPARYEVTSLTYNDSNLYIGTRDLGGSASLFIWNGSGSTAQRSVPVNAESILTGVTYKGSVVILTSTGQLLYYNGNFATLANLPCYSAKVSWSTSSFPRVFRRGMVTDGELIYINVDGGIGPYPYYLVNQPSGLWCYDQKVGLYHKAGWSNTSIYGAVSTTPGIQVSSVDTSTNIITMSGTFETRTGEPVFVDAAGNSITPLAQNTVYYAIVIDSSSFKVALTANDALNGIAIDLTNWTAAVTNFVMPDYRDYGATIQTGRAGALTLFNQNNYGFFGKTALFGAGLLEDTLTSRFNTLQSLGLGENRGHIVTVKMFSENIEDTWNKLYAKARNLFKSTDKIVAKYKVLEKEFLPELMSPPLQVIGITWVDTSSFTATYTRWQDASIGDEVEIVAGSGAGYTGHITTINNASGTYSVTIDEIIPHITAGDTSYVVVDNWSKLETLTMNETDGHKESSINQSSKWVQFKIEIRGDGVQLEELQLINETQLISA